MSTENATGSAKHGQTTDAKLRESVEIPKFPLTDALEFLRSGLHYVAKAGAPINLMNGADGTLTITIKGVYFYNGKRQAEIRFAPTQQNGNGSSVPSDGSTPQSTPPKETPCINA
ncbi:MAG: hypothetical protein MOGMAGMI_02540 [Candidatus Omnitrophica bacterium]|nr:hypothetical protein [Candidatus Omnitrophota bacterium]